MLPIPDLLALGQCYYEASHFGAAEQIYRQVLEREPANAGAWHLLGVVCARMGNRQVGVDCVRRAVALKPDWADAWLSLGNVLLEQGQLEESKTCCQRAISLLPDNPAAHQTLGVISVHQGNLEGALISFELALQLRPNQPELLFNLGSTLKRQGRLIEASVYFERAIQVRPGFAEAHYNLGDLARRLERLDEAIGHFRRTLEISPDHPGALGSLGAILRERRELAEAVNCCEKAVRLQPNYFEALATLGAAYLEQGRISEAVARLLRARDLRPDSAAIYCNLGSAYRSLGQTDEALSALRQAASLGPELADTVFFSLGNVHKDRGELDEAIACYEQAIEAMPTDKDLSSNRLYAMLYHSASNSESIRREHARWAQLHAQPLFERHSAHRNDRSPERRLRVGYLSPDFCEHPVGRYLVPLFREHDHVQFEVVCYADVARADGITSLLCSTADAWRDVHRWSDERVAELVRNDQIDVLVDLSLHTAHNRLLVFARKPAPVQLTFAGYPGTTGLEMIDYRLSDPFLDPPGEDDAAYVEKTMRLPQTFYCFEPLTKWPEVGPLPALANGFVTFGCLNHYCKVNDQALRLWARVLRETPESRLLLASAQGSHRQHAADLLQQHGVAAERLTFMNRVARNQYLAAFHGIDISLDTFPYNGYTTSAESIWMGVPVVTLVGQRVVGRSGLSVVSNVGLAELAARSEDEFVAIAAELARDLGKLSRLRLGLRDRMKRSPLMDGAGFARSIEAVYREIWRRWCLGS
jgi:protein O-GlcNAc transferase